MERCSHGAASPVKDLLPYQTGAATAAAPAATVAVPAATPALPAASGIGKLALVEWSRATPAI